MGNLNKVLLIGYLGQDPEKRVTQNGNSVTTVNLATTERFTDKQGNRQDRTEWHRIVFWNKQAELIEQYCRKGSQIYIEGRLQTRDWQDQSGNKRYTTEIVASSMQFLDKSGASSNNSQDQPPIASYDNAPPAYNNDNDNSNFIEDDIPF